MSFKSAPDFETTRDSGQNNIYNVIIKTTDAGGLVDTQTLAVTVSNVNEAPVITSNGGENAVLIMQENSKAVMTVKASDQEKSTLAWSISGGADKSLFQIDAKTGALSFKSAPDFEMAKDRGKDNIYDVTVKVTDAGKLVDTQAVSVIITDVKGKNFTGTSKADILTGTPEHDVLKGGSGNDTLTGGAGADDLYGGSGKDVFVFKALTDSSPASSGRDSIFDFTAGSDRINLSAIDASTKAPGNQAFTFIGTESFHGKAGELRYSKSGSDTFVYADIDGDKDIDFAIHIDSLVTLQRGDFLL